jgi:two-component system NtrC family sensor kinase
VDALVGQGGTISIMAEANGHQQVIIEVKDTGPGIPENLFDILFVPFFTTKGESDGTGLGLFIVRQILEQHQGLIEAFSHKGPGAWFRISLPGFAEAS